MLPVPRSSTPGAGKPGTDVWTTCRGHQGNATGTQDDEDDDTDSDEDVGDDDADLSP